MSNDTIFLNSGEIFSFELDLSDDDELNSLRVFTTQVSDNIDFSCAIEPEFFQNVSIQELEGEQDVYEGQVQFPDSISGSFSMNIQVLDGAGNTATENYVMVLSNFSLPQLDSVIFTPSDSLCILTELTTVSEIGAFIFAQNSTGISSLKAYWVSDGEVIFSDEVALSGEDEINQMVQLSVPDLNNLESCFLKLEVISTDGISAWGEYTVELDE